MKPITKLILAALLITASVVAALAAESPYDGNTVPQGMLRDVLEHPEAYGVKLNTGEIPVIVNTTIPNTTFSDSNL